jgi:hypothetical protein
VEAVQVVRLQRQGVQVSRQQQKGTTHASAVAGRYYPPWMGYHSVRVVQVSLTCMPNSTNQTGHMQPVLCSLLGAGNSSSTSGTAAAIGCSGEHHQ